MESMPHDHEKFLSYTVVLFCYQRLCYCTETKLFPLPSVARDGKYRKESKLEKCGQFFQLLKLSVKKLPDGGSMISYF